MRIEFQKEKCRRSGQCIYFHPKLFGEDPEGYPLVLVEEVPAELEDEAEDAAEICPSGAITIIPAE